MGKGDGKGAKGGSAAVACINICLWTIGTPMLGVGVFVLIFWNRCVPLRKISLREHLTELVLVQKEIYLFVLQSNWNSADRLVESVHPLRFGSGGSLLRRTQQPRCSGQCLYLASVRPRPPVLFQEWIWMSCLAVGWAVYVFAGPRKIDPWTHWRLWCEHPFVLWRSYR